MVVKPGYKQTEVGVIPEDWNPISLEELGTWKGGGTPSKSHLAYWSNGTIPWVSSGDVKVNRLSHTLYKITEASVRESSTILLDEGAVLVVMRSGILRKYLPVATNIVPVAINQDLKAVIPNKKIVADYLLHVLLHKGSHILSICMKTGTTVESIEYAWLKRYTIPLPPTIEEQHAIAEVLNDVDDQIAALDDLIAKKRDVKQSAMQALITGKTRLPGFSEAWETKQLGDLLDYEQPGRYLVKDTEYDDSGTPVLTAGKTFILGYTNEENGIYQNLPVIVFDDFTTASRYVDFPFKVKSSAIKLLKPKHKEIDLRFVFEKMQAIKFSLGDHKRYYISEYQHLEIDVPSPKEQTAIAAVLSDMDAEIAALEKRREKTRALKQGMMQELLTGKTRLI
ncbi:MAG: restriction endonuclease subunit S [Anaerolineales bacterium]|nr:restriction endonuclease subunit S [Anaerolineales bacterium]